MSADRPDQRAVHLDRESVEAIAAETAARLADNGWRGEPVRGLIESAAAAELLNVPETWVREQARADRIPHVRLGKYVRFEPETLEAWWERHRGGPVGWNHRNNNAGASPKRPPARPTEVEAP